MERTQERRAPGGWIGGIDWADLRACSARAAVGLGWLTFVAVLLAQAVGQ